MKETMKKFGAWLLAAALAFAGANAAQAADYTAANQDEFVRVAASAVSGDRILLGEGEFAIGPVDIDGKTLTFKGAGESLTTVYIGNGGYDGNGGHGSNKSAKMTFEELTLDDLASDSGYLTGFTEAAGLTFRKVTFNVGFSNWGNKGGAVSFYDCTFNPVAVSKYNVQELRSRSGTQFLFDGCVFNSAEGRFINAYKQGGTEAFIGIVVKDCTFKNTGSAGKCALNLKDSANGCTIALTFVGENKTEGTFPALDESTKPSKLFQTEGAGHVTVMFKATDEDDPVVIYASNRKIAGTWIDPDGYKSASSAVAKIGETEYETLEAAIAAAAAGDTVEIVKADTYSFPSLPNNITLSCSDGVIFNCEGSDSISSVPNGCTVIGGTFNMGQNNYHGWQHAGAMVFENSTFNGKFFGYGSMTFTGCHFVQTAEDYCMWTYSSPRIDYINCTFDCKGKAVNVYWEQHEGPTEVTADGCTFNSSKENKPALKINSLYGAFVVATTSNNTLSGFPRGISGYDNEPGEGDNAYIVTNAEFDEAGKLIGGDANREFPESIVGQYFAADLATVSNTEGETWKIGVKTEDNTIITTKPQESKVEIPQEVEIATEVQQKIEQSTKVEGVKLSAAADEGKTSGIVAVVEEAKKNTEFAAAVETAAEVSVKVEVEVKPTEYDNTADKGKVAFKLTPKATVTVVQEETKLEQVVEVTNDMIDQNQKIAVSIYTGFAPATILHKDDDGVLIESFSGDGIVYDETTGVATVKISHFSSLFVSQEEIDPYVEQGYTKVADGFYQNKATYGESTDFYITSKAGLEYFRDIVNSDDVAEVYRAQAFGAGMPDKTANYRFAGKTVNLLSDIDLGNVEWTPIGREKGADKEMFAGTFDGNNHVVSNLKTVYKTEGGKDQAGLFGYSGKALTIKNLTLKNVDITGFSYVGALISTASNENSKIINCHVIGSVSITAVSSYVGCLVGHGGCAEVSNCSVDATSGTGIHITGGGINAGGIYGYAANKPVEIKNCSVSGLSIKLDTNYVAGGIVGAVDGPATVSGCSVNNVTIECQRGPYLGYILGNIPSSKGFVAIADCTVANSTLVGHVDKFTNKEETYLVQSGVHDVPDAYYVGSGVSLDAAGKVIGGTFEHLPDAQVATGYEKVAQGTTPETWVVQLASRTITVTNTEEAQAALDAAKKGDTIVFAAGDYGTIYLRNAGDDANRILENVTLVAAENAEVTVGQIAYQKTDGKSLDIEKLVIDGFTFDEPEKSAVLFNVDGGHLLRVDGLTVQNCVKVGNNSKGTTYDNTAFIGGYYDGAMELGTKFAGDETLTCGYHDIKILNNEITNVYQPIKFPNEGPLYGLTVTGNIFTSCADSNVMMLSSKNDGAFLISDNKIVGLNGRFIRATNSTANWTITDNKLDKPVRYDDSGELDIVKIGVKSETQGTAVTESSNDWPAGSLVNGTYIANGNKELLPDYVCQIGSKGYVTVHEALDYVKARETIKLLMNVEECIVVAADKDITLDLNGKMVDAKNVPQGAAITNSGKVTVTDSSEEKTGILARKDLGGNNVWYVVDNEGEMVIDYANVTNLCDKAAGYEHASLIRNGGTMTIEDGFFQQPYVVVKNEPERNLTINGGTFSLAGSSKYDCEIQCYGNVAINGGMFDASLKYEVGATLVIAGGTFVIDPKSYIKDGCSEIINVGATTTYTVVENPPTDASAWLIGNHAAPRYWCGGSAAANAAVTAWLADSDDKSEVLHLADAPTTQKSVVASPFHVVYENNVAPGSGVTVGSGYELKSSYDDSTKVYTYWGEVTSDSAYACIVKPEGGDVYYPTLKGAISAAVANDTIKALKDDLENASFFSGITTTPLTLDLNGKTIGKSSQQKTIFADKPIILTIVDGDGLAQVNKGVFAMEGATIVIKGGTYKDQVCGKGGPMDYYKGTIIIQGGTFYNDPSVYVDQENYDVIENATEPKTWTVQAKAVCQIGDVKYPSIAAAVKAAPAGVETTIKVIADHEVGFDGECSVNVVAGQKVVIDLNGHSIDVTATRAGATEFIKNNGQLTICDTAAKVEGHFAGSISFTATNPDTAPSPTYGSDVLLNQSGTLIVAGGKLFNKSPNGACYVIDNNSGIGDTFLTVNDGELIATGSSCVRLVDFNTQGTCKNEVVVNGGFLQAKYYSLRLQTAKAPAAKLTINGGEFASSATSYDFAVCTVAGATPSVAIAGGVFNNGLSIKSAQATITGGIYKKTTYDNDNTTEELSSFVAEGYEVAANAEPFTKDDYPWAVAKKAFVPADPETPITVDITPAGKETEKVPVKVSEVAVAEMVEKGIIEKPKEGEKLTAAEVSEGLAKTQANDQTVWQNYVMGVDGTDAKNVIDTIGGKQADKAEEIVVVKTPIEEFNPPRNTGVTVTYRLLKSLDGKTWEIFREGLPTPEFDVDTSKLELGDTLWKIEAVFSAKKN